MMRLLVLFDLPVVTKKARKHYQRFHKFLLNEGYTMLQFSVYERVTKGLDGVDTHLRRLRANLPPKGNVRAMAITEKQYESMWFLVGDPTPQEKSVGGQLQILL